MMMMMIRKIYKQTTKLTTHRLRVLEEGLVDFIHGREIGHVGQEDADADDVVHARAGFFEHGGEVLEALSLEDSSGLWFLQNKRKKEGKRGRKETESWGFQSHVAYSYATIGSQYWHSSRQGIYQIDDMGLREPFAPRNFILATQVSGSKKGGKDGPRDMYTYYGPRYHLQPWLSSRG